MKKFFLATLGCSKNEVDSGFINNILQKANYEAVSSPEEAEFIIINTCGFIVPAQKESIAAILEAVELKKKKNNKLIVTGCLAQRFADELEQEIPEIDLLVGFDSLNQMPQLIAEITEGKKIKAVGKAEAELDYRFAHQEGEITAYVKVAEGCNRQCSFCAIPAIKGKYHSRPVSQIREEVEMLVAGGTKEIVLIAQDLSYYGRDLAGKVGLVSLLESLLAIPRLKWLRLLYLYPERSLRDILALMQKGSSLLPYLDLPLQHVSSQILRSMNRPGSYAAFLELIERIRQKVPSIVLRSSFILGYPGERKKDFELLLKFLQKAQLDRADFFIFSPEEGTKARHLPNQVPPKVKEKRYQKAYAIQQEISYKKNLERIGEEVEVLVEGYSDGFSWGRWAGQAPEIDGIIYLDQAFAVGEFLRARLIDAQGFDLTAQKIEE